MDLWRPSSTPMLQSLRLYTKPKLVARLLRCMGPMMTDGQGRDTRFAISTGTATSGILTLIRYGSGSDALHLLLAFIKLDCGRKVHEHQLVENNVCMSTFFTLSKPFSCV